jgi:hypothetical protein
VLDQKNSGHGIPAVSSLSRVKIYFFLVQHAWHLLAAQQQLIFVAVQDACATPIGAATARPPATIIAARTLDEEDFAIEYFLQLGARAARFVQKLELPKLRSRPSSIFADYFDGSSSWRWRR